MRIAVVTDGKYRASIAAVRALGRAGYQVIVTQTRGDSPSEPPVFSSKYADGVWIEGSVNDAEYPDRLLKVIKGCDRPVIFPVGAATLNAIAADKERFEKVARFLIADKSVLDELNDKEKVHERAIEFGFRVPREFTGEPDKFPVVIKPHCGEKLGLKAGDRYAVAKNAKDFAEKLAKMKELDPEPIVQEKIEGEGRGVSLLLGRDGELLSAICHRRLREFPASGGPSTLCVTEYDEFAIKKAHKLLKSFGFIGMAMVEFKGDAILEVNPRVWGSFPLTVFAGSSFTEKYAKAASGEKVGYTPRDYELGKKMRFAINDLAASADLIRHGRIGKGVAGLVDFFRVPEALKDADDPAPYKKYLRSYYKR